MKRRAFLAAAAASGGSMLASTACSASAPTAAATPIPKRRLGSTGVEITVFGLGGFIGMKEVRSAQFDPVAMAQAAIDAGVTYLDTAPGYGNGQSELNYGEALVGRRDRVFLASKTQAHTYDGAMREVETGLKRLRTDRLDLIQIHGAGVKDDLAAWGKPGGVLQALRKLRDDKVVRFLGVTGHESADVMLRAITMYDFDTVLTTFNPTAKRRPFLEKVLPAAVEKRMGIIAMKVMGGALGSLARGNPATNDGTPHHDDAARQADAAELIRYVLGLPISTAIVGTGSMEQLKVNLTAARSAAPLNAQERTALEVRMAGRTS